MNTKISYLYRDADNYKMHNKCVIAGTLTTEQARKMLDFAGIGRMMRCSENGVFVGSLYVLQDGELTTAPPCAKDLPEKPGYLFRLTLGLHPDIGDARTVTLDLPAAEAELLDAQEQLGVEGWEGVTVIDYLGTEDTSEYLSDALVATLRGIIADSANRTNGILFKCAVEQGIMAHTIAAHFRDTLEDRRALRGYVVDEVKRTNGQIRFEDAQDVQRQLPDDTWRG